ncbi:MAG: DUF5615 family PIN-like protein [Promethearchaeota archaeon]
MNKVPAFLCDAMVGKLARLLRIFGFDAVYAEDIENSAPDSKLLEFALKNNRIILTRDLAFHKIAGSSSLYLDEIDPYKNLIFIKNVLNLTLDFSIKNARCSACNSLLKKIEKKSQVKHLVKPDTYQTFDDFYLCTNEQCKKVYWKGSHIEKILLKLRNMEN